MKRREFLKGSVITAGAMVLPVCTGRQPFPHHLFASTLKKYASDRVKLGATGITLSRLAMGTGTNGAGRSSNQTRQLGLRGLADLLHAAYDQGVNFWDSADQYGSHPHLKAALKTIPREQVVILSKTHATTEKQMRADLERFRQELGTDYIDIVLLHCMMDANWPAHKEGAMSVLAQARADGLIRAHGVSCHTLGALRAAAECDWVQVDLARINPAGVNMDADVSTVAALLKKMKQAGKGVMAMKVLGAGRLRHRIDESLQYMLAQDFVDCFTIGTESREQMEDLLKRIPPASVRG